MTTKLVLTVPEAAAALGLSKNLCYSLIREGRIPSVRLGARKIAIPRAALERFIEESAMRSTGAA